VPSPLAYSFRAELLPWEVRRDLWTLVTLPRDVSEEIREVVGDLRRGFGAVRVRARIGATTWSTSVFPQTAGGCYVLPVKRSVRDANRLDVGDEVDVSLDLVL
jgi:hypothetical protein